MNKIARRLFSLILKYRIFIIISVIAPALFALAFIPKIKFDNSVEAFFDKKSESYVNFQKWKEQFGDDQVIILALSFSDVFTRKNLELVSNLTERFEALEYVREVESLATVNDIIGSESDFIVEKFIEEVPSDPAAIERLKERALSNPLYVKNLVSENGRTAAVIIELENMPGKGDEYKRETTESVFAVCGELIPDGLKYYISGPTAMEYFYTRYMYNDIKTFLPAAFAIIAIILILTFRSAEGVILPLAAITVTLVFTMFFVYLMGFSINNLTTIIPPIILAIAVADIIHFVGRIKKQRNLRETVKELAVPCILTTLTTAAGFFSLTVSELAPIRQIGLVVGLGVLLAFAVTFTLIPAIIEQFLPFREPPRGEKRVFNEIFDRSMTALAGFVRKFRNAILVAAAALILVSFWGVSKIKVDTNILDYFKKKTFIYRSTRFIDKNLTGTNFLEISLKSSERDYFKKPEVLREISRLQEYLSEMPEVDKTLSVTEYIKEINKSFHNEDARYYAVPPTQKMVSQYLLLYGATDLHDFVDSEWKWATVQARLNVHGNAEIKKVLKKTKDYLNGDFKIEAEKELLGWPVLDVETNGMITRGQLQSLSVAILIIFAMMFIVFRSLPLALISIVPNALPILLNFGAMGMLGLRLDTATSMVSAIGIGIIVDDTIHFIHSFKEEIKKDWNYPLSVERALLNKGRPIVMTSVVLFFGFGAVIFSNFMCTVKFGMLTSMMMISALLGDLVVLPALILFFRPKPR